MIRAWRLLKTRYAAAAFAGEGGWRFGGRWNSPGVRVAYASESVALAVLEVLVHLQSTAPLPAYSLVSVRFPESIVERLKPRLLPAGWRRSPPPARVQVMGDRWVRAGRTVVLRVPSAVIPGGINYLLNPAHADFRRVVIDSPAPFDFDPRLLGS